MGSFGIQLRKLRKERGLRQKDVAEVLGIAQTTVANYETGIRFPDELTLHQAADYFGVTLDYLLGRSDVPLPVNQVPGYSPQGEQPPLSEDARFFLKNVLKADSAKAEAFLADLREKNISCTSIYMEIIQPALYEVGRLWETGEIDVMQEHLFSESTIDLMNRITAGTRGSNKGPGFLGFSVGGEQHSIGIKMVTDLLAERDFRTYFMGINLPVPSVLKALRDLDVDVVGVSAAMAYHVNAAAVLISAIHGSDLFRKVKVVVGGQAFNRDESLWAAINADGFARNAEEAVTLIQDLAG